MSILSTDKKLISFGTDYSAGSGISIIDHTISIVPSAVGKVYSAGPNIGIYDVSGQPTISSKDWTQEIDQSSSGAVTESISQFHDWINGQYTEDISNVTNNLTALSGDLSSYYKKTETSSKAEISAALDYVSAHAVGDVEVNNYVHNNSATIDEVNSAYQSNSAIWNETSNVVSSNSAQWSEGKTYEGVSPIVVNNNESKISADTWTLSAGDGVSLVDFSAEKVTRIDCTATGDAGVNSFVTNNSASILDVNTSYTTNSSIFLTAHQSLEGYATIEDVENATSGKADTTSVVEYKLKPSANAISAYGNTLANVGQIADNSSHLYIIPSGVLQVPSIITATNQGITANGLSATNAGLLANTLSATINGLTANTLSANADGLLANTLSATINGLTAYGLTANKDTTSGGFSANGISAGKYSPLYLYGRQERISAGGNGFTFSSVNTGFGTAQLTTANSNQYVQTCSPKFEARTSAGAGFSIEASGAKGYDESGNVVWDTQNPQVKNIISYSDTKTAQGGLNGNIILTTQPSTNASNLTSSPYVIMDATQASYFASYGPSAQTPTVKLKPDTITFEYPVGNSGRTTVGYNNVKQELSGSSWTLTGSIQKRELEYDTNTSAITAIAGSAIGGGGVTGEFVPQSAFDELKASYDALSASYVTLSSLFATYSGQWLLPNEGV